MKPCKFIEFYRMRNGSYVEACGSDGVAYMDGRWSVETMRSKAREIGKARGFDGFRIVRGTHTRPFYLTAAVISIG